MARSSLHVEGLDCAEEISLIRAALGSKPGVKQLEFNLLEAKVIIDHDPQEIEVTEMILMLRKAGLSASVEFKAPSFWKRKGRLIACGLSALFLVAGLFSPFFYLASILCGVIYVLPKAYFSLRRLRADMNLLMVIAVLGAIGIQQWFEAASVAFLFSLALLLEQWSVGRARRAIESLLDLAPVSAHLFDSKTGEVTEVLAEKVQVGNIVLIRPGEKIPVDGVVIEGFSSVNQAPITGESLPVDKGPKDSLYAGTLNGEGTLQCEVKEKASDTVLARMIQLVEEARSKRSESEQWVETFAHYYTPLMLLFSLIVMIFPPLFFSLPWTFWIYRGLVLLVIACPCALVISTPVSIISGLTAAAKEGVLIKGGLFLELAGKLEAIALDKTGTLTYGRPEVQRVVPLNNHTEAELIERAVALEKASEHPLARAILSYAEKKGVSAKPATGYQVMRGKGALATYNQKLYWIGSHRFMHEMGQETPEIHQRALSLEDAGHTVIAIGTDDHVCGLLSVADAQREGIASTLEEIRNAGVKHIEMLTGDNEPTAKALAKLAGVNAYKAELLPDEKVARVCELTELWGCVAMVGDGINDAPAMAAATIGIAMGGIGSDVAIETADIALMADDLSKLPWLMRHARRVNFVIKQNITFALGVKGVFIALALFDVATLWMAIGADTGATLLVIFNSLRLLR